MNLKLYPFQEEDVNLMRWWAQEKKALHCLNANPTGSGKTAEAVAVINHLGLRSGYCLIVVPVTLINQWCERVEEWLGVKALPIRGCFAERQELLNQAVGRRMIVVCSYGTLVGHAEHFVHNPPEFFIPDEAHRLTGRPASWEEITAYKAGEITKKPKGTLVVGTVHAMVRTDKVLHKLLMTATPADKSPAELWSLLHIFEPHKYTSYWRFAEMFCEYRPGRYTQKEYAGPKNAGQLQDLLRGYVIRRRKEIILPDLPPMREETVYLDMEPEQLNEQARLYREMKERWLTQTDSGETLSVMNKAAQLVRLKQLAVSPALLGGDVVSPKFDYCFDIVDGASDPVCIFSQFRTAVDILERLFQERGVSVVRITGDEAEKERTAAYKAINARTAQVCLFTRAGGEGIDLVGANRLIFLDLDWSSRVLKQARDRIHRIGQQNPVLVSYLLMRGTVDEYVWKLLQKKQEWTEGMMVEQVYQTILERTA